jgi:phage-related protein
MYRQTLFERDLVKTLIIDVNKRTITSDDRSLNNNIRNLKNDYY